MLQLTIIMNTVLKIAHIIIIIKTIVSTKCKTWQGGSKCIFILRLLLLVSCSYIWCLMQVRSCLWALYERGVGGQVHLWPTATNHPTTDQWQVFITGNRPMRDGTACERRNLIETLCCMAGPHQPMYRPLPLEGASGKGSTHDLDSVDNLARSINQNKPDTGVMSQESLNKMELRHNLSLGSTFRCHILAP